MTVYPSSKIEIVRMNECHLKEMADLELSCFGKMQAWSQEMLASELDDKSKNYFVATENNCVIGYAGYAHIIDEAHIMNIAVAEAYRRKGIASHLLENVLTDAKIKGITAVTLEVSSKNAAAICFYEKYGFELAGLRKGYYPDGSDGLIYWLHF